MVLGDKIRVFFFLQVPAANLKLLLVSLLTFLELKLDQKGYKKQTHLYQHGIDIFIYDVLKTNKQTKKKTDKVQFTKGAVTQIEKALIYDHLRFSKVS